MRWAIGLVFFMWTGVAASAETCLKISLTGTQGGPPVFQGQAGAGTLVQYGEASKGCGDVRLQFDTGRGTTQRLSQLGVPVGKLNAIFLTHMHSDHVEGLGDIVQLRWQRPFTKRVMAFSWNTRRRLGPVRSNTSDV